MNKFKHLTLKQLYGFSLMKWERIQKRLDEEYYLDETEGELDELELRIDMSEECAFCFDAGKIPVHKKEVTYITLDCEHCKIDHTICDNGTIYREDTYALETVECIILELKKKYYELEKECEK
jgi:hypothetical protein